MKIGKNSPEKILEKLVELEPVEFLGICRILDVKIFKDTDLEESVEGARVIEKHDGKEPRDFYDIWCDVCDTINSMSRTRRRNLNRLVRAATEKEK